MANTKSTSITNLDYAGSATNVPIQPSAGAGAQAYAYELDDFTAVTSAAAANDTFQVIRVPTHALMKSLWFYSTAFAATTFTVDITLNYSDNGPFDGSNPSNTGNVDGATFFASQYSIGTAAMPAPVNVLYGGTVATAGTFVAGNEQTPLWSVAGLTSDPGGYFDVIVKLHTVTGAVTAGKFVVQANYVISGAL